MLWKETNNTPSIEYRKGAYLLSNQDRGVTEGLMVRATTVEGQVRPKANGEMSFTRL
jgi:hypothetical protein